MTSKLLAEKENEDGLKQARISKCTPTVKIASTLIGAGTKSTLDILYII
jgi:hypothetical protein